jgi:hypothetical protein
VKNTETVSLGELPWHIQPRLTPPFFVVPTYPVGNTSKDMRKSETVNKMDEDITKAFRFFFIDV